MFATLGNILIDLLSSPDSYEADRKYTYAEHKVVEAKPILQWISDDLEELTFEFRMHISYTNPGLGLQNLRTAASQHAALAFVYGNGYHRGKFVITEIDVTYQVMSDLGDLVAVTAKVTLKEWVPDTSNVSNTNPPFIPIGLTQDSSDTSVPQLLDQPGASSLIVTGASSVPSPLPAGGNFLEVTPATIVRAGT